MVEDRFLSHEYIAGLFDGEGWFSIVRGPGTRYKWPFQYQAKAGIVLKEKWILDEIQSEFGGLVRKQKKLSSKHATYWKWMIHDRQLNEFLQVIAKHLLIKKRQANLALEFTQAKRDHGYRALSEEQYQYRLNCYNLMKEFNKRGVDRIDPLFV